MQQSWYQGLTAAAERHQLELLLSHQQREQMYPESWQNPQQTVEVHSHHHRHIPPTNG